MLLDLLINASLAAPDSRFARLLRRIDRSMLLMAEVDARSQRTAPPSRVADPGQAALLRRRASQASSRPSVATSPAAMTSPPAS
jgi:hypothetical protein